MSGNGASGRFFLNFIMIVIIIIPSVGRRHGESFTSSPAQAAGCGSEPFACRLPSGLRPRPPRAPISSRQGPAQCGAGAGIGTEERRGGRCRSRAASRTGCAGPGVSGPDGGALAVPPSRRARLSRSPPASRPPSFLPSFLPSLLFSRLLRVGGGGCWRGWRCGRKRRRRRTFQDAAATAERGPLGGAWTGRRRSPPRARAAGRRAAGAGSGRSSPPPPPSSPASLSSRSPRCARGWGRRGREEKEGGKERRKGDPAPPPLLIPPTHPPAARFSHLRRTPPGSHPLPLSALFLFHFCMPRNLLKCGPFPVIRQTRRHVPPARRAPSLPPFCLSLPLSPSLPGAD